MNTLPSRHKQCHFVSPLYLIKLKIAQIGRPLAAVHSNKLIVPDFRRKSFNVPFFHCLLENSFSSLLTENISRSHAFYQKFIFKLSMVNFSM